MGWVGILGRGTVCEGGVWEGWWYLVGKGVQFGGDERGGPEFFEGDGDLGVWVV